MMNIRDYLYNLKEKVKKYDKNAQNPFFKSGNNPFSEGFSQTYVWIESVPNEHEQTQK